MAITSHCQNLDVSDPFGMMDGLHESEVYRTAEQTPYVNAVLSASMLESPESLGTIEEPFELSKLHWSDLGTIEEPFELSKLHWSDLAYNQEVWKTLQLNPIWGRFFEDCAGLVLGKKIAEGAQAEIFDMKVTWMFPNSHEKVFKNGTTLRLLQSQWPQGLCWLGIKTERSSTGRSSTGRSSNLRQTLVRKWKLRHDVGAKSAAAQVVGDKAQPVEASACQLAKIVEKERFPRNVANVPDSNDENLSTLLLLKIKELEGGCGRCPAGQGLWSRTPLGKNLEADIAAKGCSVHLSNWRRLCHNELVDSETEHTNTDIADDESQNFASSCALDDDVSSGTKKRSKKKDSQIPLQESLEDEYEDTVDSVFQLRMTRLSPRINAFHEDALMSRLACLEKRLEDKLEYELRPIASALQALARKEQEDQQRLKAIGEKRRALDLEEMKITCQRVGRHHHPGRSSFKQQGFRGEKFPAGGV